MVEGDIAELECKGMVEIDLAGPHLDMTPAVVIGLVGFIALRYISRGVGEVEILVLSGVASALFMGPPGRDRPRGRAQRLH